MDIRVVFHYGAMMNNAVLNIHIQVFVGTYVFISLGHIPKSWMLAHMVTCLTLGELLTFLKSSCMILHDDVLTSLTVGFRKQQRKDEKRSGFLEWGGLLAGDWGHRDCWPWSRRRWSMPLDIPGQRDPSAPSPAWGIQLKGPAEIQPALPLPVTPRQLCTGGGGAGGAPYYWFHMALWGLMDCHGSAMQPHQSVSREG